MNKKEISQILLRKFEMQQISQIIINWQVTPIQYGSSKN